MSCFHDDCTGETELIEADVPQYYTPSEKRERELPPLFALVQVASKVVRSGDDDDDDVNVDKRARARKRRFYFIYDAPPVSADVAPTLR